METKANYALVGSFTVFVLFCAFVLFYYISGLGEKEDLKPLDIRISGSVMGLTESSKIFFNGIPVGVVRRLVLDETNSNMVIAKTYINAMTPLTRSTVAILGFQGLTGLAFIELRGGKTQEPNLLKEAEESDSVARIDANSSTLNNMFVIVQDLIAHANQTLGNLDNLTKEVRIPLTEALKNSQKFTEAFRSDNAISLVNGFNKVSEHLDVILVRLEEMLSSKDPNALAGQARDTLSTLQRALVHIGRLADNLERFTGRDFRNMDALISDGRRSLQHLEQLVTDIERNPKDIIFGKGDSIPLYNGRR
ncbi:MAG: phospholipid/cholesterol/gamma-HCH transport system substrate-binding protein [Candidatus Tokpelaia sp. JSC161]|jgi:phospholipid/cholesterol/gamma-HCH transport system substrate-binding protein|nr:MAG: phospholipid/cholesterol/gamma-HCH transport system substrate-binding protein [Candidatus Tokpelaia sp. JSC161]